jgi:hypothetical protein
VKPDALQEAQMIPQGPSTNIQVPKKHQAPNSKTTAHWFLKFGCWMFSGVWSLEFGA